MEKRNWVIGYSNDIGPEKRAIELVSTEVGKYLLRDEGIFAYHVLPCVPAADLPNDRNAIVLGTLSENPILRRYIRQEEVPQNGYLVRVMDHPEKADLKLALICGASSANVFYGAVDFVDDYLASATPTFDSFLKLNNELFCHSMPDYQHASEPSFRTRSVFTWGHPINDYQSYIANLARLRLNQVIIWNDYLPINARDVVDCAHSYGMQVIWGFAWGWGQKCAEANIHDLAAMQDAIMKKYHDSYRDCSGDGIYFQSFTELPFDVIDGVTIADAVTELVNNTAAAILREKPDLHIQFGLHATSVKNHLVDIARVDDRIEIVWEDCGSFPYKVCGQQFTDDDSSKRTLTDDMIRLRNYGKTGLVYKCQTTMDWSRGRVEHQTGPYVLGKMSSSLMEHDEHILAPLWRSFCVEWLEHGEEAIALTRQIFSDTHGNNNMCIAGMLSGGIWFPTALCAQMFWDCSESFAAMRRRVLSRNWVRI
ncbi:MAG: hypothetical protein PHI98_15410 [Eubacteriales bacterium]|nr:hypothetical protein [Eubacteriales bacterium]